MRDAGPPPRRRALLVSYNRCSNSSRFAEFVGGAVKELAACKTLEARRRRREVK